jgi:glycosyltransferase involved in cell wall biosynthesis/SAM-dependent methyltransferase
MLDSGPYDLSTITMQCPLHGSPLTIEGPPEGQQFSCQSGCKHPVVAGIPRFVTSDPYASSFGLQWNTFRKTQLDSYTGTSISRDRLTRILGGDLSVVRGRIVLEAGCGAGRFTEILLAAGANVFAVDLSSAVEANYDNCKKSIDGANYFVCQADIRTLPLAPAQFDLVLCIGVVQHTPSPEETIAALCSQVKPGGMLALDHYTHGYGTSPSRQLLRSQLLEMPAAFAMTFCSTLTDVLWPIHDLLWKTQRSPGGYSARQAFLEQSPLVDYHDSYPQLSADILRSWALLDMHDTVTDVYKHLRSAEEISSCLRNCGMSGIETMYAGNGVEARAFRQHDNIRLDAANGGHSADGTPTTNITNEDYNGDVDGLLTTAEQFLDNCDVNTFWEGTTYPAKVKRDTDRTRVLFLAWGYSIHAKRRLQLFVDDPAFQVLVASPHDYAFAGAENVLLTGNLQPSFDFSAMQPEIGLASDLLRRLKLGELSEVFYDVCVGIHDLRILRAAIDRFQPDVIFLQTLLYPCYLSYFVPKAIPMIVTFWNGDVIWWAKWNGLDRLYKKMLVTYGSRRASAITVNSRMAYNACINYGVDAERIHLIRYPAVDRKRFFPMDKIAAQRVTGISGEKVILCPRGLGGYLNSEIIIEAAAIVCSKFPNATFVFISGVGKELWDQHLQRGKELGIERNLRYDGQVSWETMPAYYASADVMVSISSNESLPNCMLEAMACGVPLVMGDIPQIRDWVVNGQNGFLVPVMECAALARSIIEVCENKSNVVADFVSANIELVEREADSSKNIQQVKNLVRQVARSAVRR